MRFNSVSSSADARKSSGDETGPKDNFGSAGPLANVRYGLDILLNYLYDFTYI